MSEDERRGRKSVNMIRGRTSARDRIAAAPAKGKDAKVVSDNGGMCVVKGCGEKARKGLKTCSDACSKSKRSWAMKSMFRGKQGGYVMSEETARNAKRAERDGA